MRTFSSKLLWAALSLSASVGLGATMFGDNQAKHVFLPGETTAGHYQIELACNACHTQAFASGAQLQAACENCHAAELNKANDSHPKAKFTDPRNASRLAVLDARSCVTCHQEHTPAATNSMGVTLPEDYCYQCHQDIAEDRPSHAGMPYDSCDDAGCHNFHDNRALYEDYLIKHLDAPEHRKQPRVRALSQPVQISSAPPPAQLAAAPAQLGPLSTEEQRALKASAHANVSCRDCHASAESGQAVVVDHNACRSCHGLQVEGWLSGRHGMRLAQGLSAMQVGMARAEMNADRAHVELSCNSCHPAHATNTRFAAVEACQGCHADEHSEKYRESAHARSWQRELAGEAPAGSGVSCATCHMPRSIDEASKRVFVQHNQNDNLRPREKMVRGVCDQCHGPGFALAALADESLVQNNFNASPIQPLESMTLVRARRDATQ